MKWLVITPAYDVVKPILDYGQGPIHEVWDVIEVKARTKREAITKGVALMLRTNAPWVTAQRADGRCPYTGVKAERYWDL